MDSLPGSIADPDPGSGDFLTPGTGMGKNQDPDPGSGFGMNIPDYFSDRELRKKFLG
jgi:hypothetical protein